MPQASNKQVAALAHAVTETPQWFFPMAMSIRNVGKKKVMALMVELFGKPPLLRLEHIRHEGADA
jgi:hypothetical protein